MKRLIIALSLALAVCLGVIFILYSVSPRTLVTVLVALGGWRLGVLCANLAIYLVEKYLTIR